MLFEGTLYLSKKKSIGELKDGDSVFVDGVLTTYKEKEFIGEIGPFETLVEVNPDKDGVFHFRDKNFFAELKYSSELKLGDFVYYDFRIVKVTPALKSYFFAREKALVITYVN